MTGARPVGAGALVSALAAACLVGGDTVLPGGTGAIRVIVSTTGVQLDEDGYEASLDGRVGLPIATDGTVTFSNVTVGPHAITLSGAALNCPLPPESPAIVDVAASGTTEIRFEVECGYLLYITHNASPEDATGFVAVFETVTHTLVASVRVGFSPDEIAFTPDGAHVYVANFLSDDVSVIQTADHHVVATIPVGNNPVGVAVEPGGAFVYISNLHGGSVSVIETATNAVVSAVPMPFPRFISFTPDGAFAYVPFQEGVSVLETEGHSEVAVIDTSPFSSIWGVAVTADGLAVYLADQGLDNEGNQVAVAGTAANVVTATVGVGTAPAAVALTPDDAFVYVPNSVSDDVSVIETSTRMVVATVPVGDGPVDVVVTPDGTRAYVSNLFSNEISVIDTATNEVVASFPANGPLRLAIKPAS